MPGSRGTWLAGALLGAAAGVLLLAGSASAAVIVHRADSGQAKFDRRTASEYWTRARMRRAEPLETRLHAGTPGVGAARPALRPSPRPSAAAGFDAADSIAPQLPARSPATAAPRIKVPHHTSGPIPLAAYRAYPYSANGRLFFTYRGDEYVCSATSVASKSRSTVLTAGHCVHDRKLGWAKNVAFVPAYWAGYAPYGAWPAKLEVAPRGWVKREYFANDYAALKVIRSPYGPIARIVGSLGLAWDQTRHQRFQAIGYPSNHYEGEAMWTCLSRSAGADPFFRGPGRADTGIGCDMGHGASGGSWTIHRNKHRFINSLTSYGYTQKPNLIFGPYFTKQVRNIVRTASRH